MTWLDKEKINLAYKSAFGIYKPISFNWLYDFYDFLEQSGCPRKQLAVVINKLLAKENLNSMTEGEFLRDSVSEKNEKSFFAYLGSIKEKLTPEYLSLALEDAIKNSQDINLIDAFIRYIVASNQADLNFKANNIEAWAANRAGRIYCSIGDFPLCKIGIIKVVDEDSILFDEFYTRKNLTGLGLGTLLFTEFLKEMNRCFPDKNVFAGTVLQSNTRAINFYAKMGGEFYLPESDKPILLSDIDSSVKENIAVVFSKEKIAKMCMDSEDDKLKK